MNGPDPSGHALNWEPGSGWGKGVFTNKGSVYTWPVDKSGAPHHSFGPDECRSIFNIDPDGELTGARWAAPNPWLEQDAMKEIAEIDPNLHYQGDSPWNFTEQGREQREDDIAGFKNISAKIELWDL